MPLPLPDCCTSNGRGEHCLLQINNVVRNRRTWLPVFLFENACPVELRVRYAKNVQHT